MNRKKRADSVDADIQAFQNFDDEVPLPEGVEFRSDDEKVIWRQFTKVRAKNAWRDFDLVLLAKAVKLEIDIRKAQALIDKSGVLVNNQRGTPIENPILRVVDTLQRQQLAIIRSLSLNQTESDPRTLNAEGAKQEQTLKTMSGFNLESLIARPH